MFGYNLCQNCTHRNCKECSISNGGVEKIKVANRAIRVMERFSPHRVAKRFARVIVRGKQKGGK